MHQSGCAGGHEINAGAREVWSVGRIYPLVTDDPDQLTSPRAGYDPIEKAAAFDGGATVAEQGGCPDHKRQGILPEHPALAFAFRPRVGADRIWGVRFRVRAIELAVEDEVCRVMDQPNPPPVASGGDVEGALGVDTEGQGGLVSARSTPL